MEFLGALRFQLVAELAIVVRVDEVVCWGVDSRFEKGSLLESL